jgi:putative endonuclease
MFYVYILRTNRNTLYIGQTNNLELRLQQHSSHSPRASKYMRSFASFELAYAETFETRSEALKREIQLKQLSHSQKELLIRG